jgi:hypothetical protein
LMCENWPIPVVKIATTAGCLKCFGQNQVFVDCMVTESDIKWIF